MLRSPSSSPNQDEILETFLSYLEGQGIELYDHQEEAILEIFNGRHVILNTPTGSGKSMVAMAMQYQAICLNRRSYYTVPIKALANEKFLSLCQTFGPENVGMITGDATVNAEAPVICCTAEILANFALRDGVEAKIDDVIMDEFHYYSDKERGVAWQVPLLALPKATFLLMSATLGETSFFIKELEERTGKPAVLVQSDVRPVPLEFEYSETPLVEKVTELVLAERAPIYLVNFTQRACAEVAQNLLSVNLCSKEEKKVIAGVLEEGDFKSPYGKEIAKVLRHGVGIHHAGLLPKYRILVERLAQKGLLKVICGTDTLGVGVNVPIRTVLFTQLCKYDGSSSRILTVRDFKQICGRAGRRGFDSIGYVVCQAPEHVIENKKIDEKASSGKGGKKKAVKKKPPEKGFVAWSDKTFEKLQVSAPEPLLSRFQVSHGMLLHLLSRKGVDGCEELRQLIDRSHETDVQKKTHRVRARKIFSGLVRGQVFQIIPPAERRSASKVSLNADLQDDFSMNQALGLFLLDALSELDTASPQYAYQTLSLIESILENPQMLLRKQLDEKKSALIVEWKNAGVPYEERMDRLEEIDYDKPEAEWIYDAYNRFVKENPWMDREGIRPKSIAREMFESYASFDDYIRKYGLERSEALLLRHLSQVYKVLSQTVPPAAKNEDLVDVEAYLEEMVRGVDSTLIDEWEKMQDPTRFEEKKEQFLAPQKFTHDKKKLLREVRGQVFALLTSIEKESWQKVLSLLTPGALSGETLTRELIENDMDLYYADFAHLQLDPEARSREYTRIVKQEHVWEIEQALLEPGGGSDCFLRIVVDLKACDDSNSLVMSWGGVLRTV